MRFKDYDKKFMLGIPIVLHTIYKQLAKQKGITMNELIIKILEKFIEEGKDI